MPGNGLYGQINMKHKKLFIIFLSIFLLLLLFGILTSKKKPKMSPAGQNGQEQKAPGANFSDLLSESSLETNQSFFLNRIDTLPGVNGYSWSQNELIYSTRNGIYSAENNQALVDAKIDSIAWNRLAQAVYSQTGQWFWADAKTKEVKPIPLTGQMVKLNPTQPYLAVKNNSSLKVFSQTDYISPKESFDNQVVNFFWANDWPILAVQTNQVEIINIASKEKSVFPLPTGAQLKGISPQGNLINIYSPLDKNLLFTDRNGKTVATVNLPDTDSLAVSWLDDKDLIVLATSQPDSLGRVIDFIWLVNTDGSKKFLANSQPIPNRLDPLIPVFPNADKNVVGLVENNNTVWILSLLPDQFPSYYQRAVNFFIPSTKGD